MSRDQVIDVLAAVARELLDLDMRLESDLIAGLAGAVVTDGHKSPYLGAIVEYAREAWLVCECGEDTTDELFVVTDEIWDEAYPAGGPARSNPCLTCLEDALGRDLEPDDFADDPINDETALRSPRLLQRMGSLGG